MSSGTQRFCSVPDEEVVRQFRETHDNNLFAELFRRHKKRVYLACRSFFSNGAAAEDASQEAFLRAYQNMNRFLEGDFCHWLLRIARNVCIDEWRKRKPQVEMDETEPGSIPAAGSWEAASDLRLAAEKLRQEIRLLPSDQRRCLELKIEGYSYEETSARTGLSLEAVKSHLQNGRRMLWLKMENMLTQLK
jgi:RNA polymerase sigma-70 factor (ECF subfamily)